jgi:hypothetical protein
MFRRCVTALLISLQLFGPAAAFSISDGQYYFRYKTSISAVPSNDDDSVSKDITAFYIAGVGEDFSEKLPMKPQWEDDAWSVVGGSLPAGISFDPSTLTFEGKATSVVTKVVADLKGRDASGQEVASATATFSVYNLPDQVVNVDIYHHVGQYGADALTLPAGVTIDGDPTLLSPIPPGVTFNARYFDGTPTTAGVYPVLAFGYDYTHTQPIIAFKGKYTVDDAPVFATIKDDLRKLVTSDYWGCGSGSECALWNQENLPQVIRPINKASDVKYYVEVKAGDTLPGTLRFGDNPSARQKNGRTYTAYDQATIRYKAVDIDDKPGYSNWFKIGSLGHSELCKPTSGNSIIIGGTVGSLLAGSAAGYPIPDGKDGSVKQYAVTAGTLPSGINFNSTTGAFFGTPTKLGTTTGVSVTISYPSLPGSTPTVCGPYDFSIAPSPLSLTYSGLKDDYRVGEAVDVTLAPKGTTISPYSIAIAADAVLPTGVTYDPTTKKLSGTATSIGDNFGATFVLTNGDGITYRTGLAFSVHAPVKVDSVPPLSQIKRYESVDQLFNVTYDASAIIGDATWTLNGGSLPNGFTFNKGTLTVGGGTCLPVNKYGPFSISLKDSTGQSDKTNDFYIDVTERDALERGATTDPLTFAVNLQDAGQKAFSVTRPALATSCLPQLQYTLTPSTLPSGLSFNPSTGYISGTPTAKSTISGYSLKIDEVSPYNYSETSEPFSIVVNDPSPIKDITLSTLNGNAGATTRIFSTNPTAALRSIRNSLVGYEQAVVFDSASPIVPGLSLNTSTGVLEGVPTAEFSGDVTISYHDGGNRSGKLIVPVAIYPYPSLTTSQLVYELPRLADADDYGISVTPANTGFYKGATYSLAPTSDALPVGLKLKDNLVQGYTTAAKGQSLKIIIRATSKADASIYADQAFALNVVQEQPTTLDLKPDGELLWTIDGTTGTVETQQKFTSTKPSGSYVKPYAYSLPSGPSWMKIDANGQLSGTPPKTGSYPVTVQIEEAEGHKASDTVIVKITLSGYVQITPGGSNGTIKVRQGESFKTQPETVSNAVAPFIYKVTGNKPASIDFDETTGVFSGRVDQTLTATWYLDALDADDRKAASAYPFTVTTVEPVAIDAPLSAVNGKQYDPTSPITVQFMPAKNIMGKASYAVTGKVPGTLYYKFYANDTAGGLATYVHYNDDGSLSTVQQNPLETYEQTEFNRLAPDHMIFDTLSLQLTGIPSVSGTFAIGLYVFDDHHDTGYLVDPADPTRDEANQKSSDTITVTVEKADDLIVANSATTETLYQYTSVPTLTSTASHDAYGRGVVWTKIASSGNLPSKITQYNATAQKLGYTGYPDTQGTWSNILWQATDSAGRKADTQPVAFTVGPRQALQLVASTSLPRGMVVFDGDADLTITTKNRADGEAIGMSNWTVAGVSNLPPGVTYAITDNNVRFTGTSSVIGIYKDIIVSAVDSRGGTASLNLTFKVISSGDPIELNVSEIKTKAGYPIIMEPPFAAALLMTGNTYGTVKFYSNDLPSIPGIQLNGTTGYIDGTLSTAQNLTFDLFVTDDTNRVTSKPVSVSVMPNLRLIAPTQVTATQGSVTSTAIATDYVVGTVSYEKGAGVWPVGFVVDPMTGTISSNYINQATGVTSTTVVAASGTYSGLTIVGKDAFGTYIDQQSSNTFAIKIDPTTASPDIADQSKTILGTEGQPIAAWAPKKATGWVAGVVEKGKVANAWNYAGTVYASNYDLSQYGLTLDTTTGVISGTPNAPFILRDFVMTVTSQRGDTDSTAPFWLGVAPKDPIVAVAAQKAVYYFRLGDYFATDPILIQNPLGNYTFAAPTYVSLNTGATGTSGTPMNSTTGVWGAIVATNTGWVNAPYNYTTTITDEFGRTGTFTWFADWRGALNATAAASLASLDKAYTAASPVVKPTVTGLAGNATWAVTGLPTGLTFDPSTGAVYGTIDSSKVAGGSYTATFQVTDTWDNRPVSINAVITVVSGYKYWRFTATAVKVHASGDFLCLSELRWFAGASDVSTAGTLTADSLYDSTKYVGQLVDGVYGSAGDFTKVFCTGGLTGSADFGKQHWIQLQLTDPAVIDSLTIYDRRDGSSQTHPTAWTISMSQDGVNWTNAWTGANSTMTNGSVYTTKP